MTELEKSIKEYKKSVERLAQVLGEVYDHVDEIIDECQKTTEVLREVTNGQQ